MSDDKLTRLREDAGSLEQELLRSGAEDAPATGVKAAAMARVLEQHRRELSARRSRRYAALGGGVALAAAAALLLRAPKPSTPLAAEPSTAQSARSPAPVSSLSPLSRLAPVTSLSPCSPVLIGSGHDFAIDDFEDGDSRLILVDKRAGSWVTFNDATAAMRPHAGAGFSAERLPGGRGASHFGLHVSGGRFSKWGAVLSVELSPRRCYDASQYAGIGFWARGQAQLRVGVKMTQVVAEEFGGSCTKDCYDGHAAEVSLSKDWRHYELRWDELVQTGFGSAIAFDPRSLFSLEFAVPPKRPPFDYWLDDVTFIAR